MSFTPAGGMAIGESGCLSVRPPGVSPAGMHSVITRCHRVCRTGSRDAAISGGPAARQSVTPKPSLPITSRVSSVAWLRRLLVHISTLFCEGKIKLPASFGVALRSTRFCRREPRHIGQSALQSGQRLKAKGQAAHGRDRVLVIQPCQPYLRRQICRQR